MLNENISFKKVFFFFFLIKMKSVLLSQVYLSQVLFHLFFNSILVV